jgi:hypothetical protein
MQSDCHIAHSIVSVFRQQDFSSSRNTHLYKHIFLFSWESNVKKKLSACSIYQRSTETYNENGDFSDKMSPRSFYIYGGRWGNDEKTTAVVQM